MHAQAPQTRKRPGEADTAADELKARLDAVNGSKPALDHLRESHEQDVAPVDPKLTADEVESLTDLAAGVPDRGANETLAAMLQEQMDLQSADMRTIQFAEQHFKEFDIANLFLNAEVTQSIPVTGDLHVELRVSNGIDEAHIMSAAKKLAEQMVGPERFRAVQRDRSALGSAGKSANQSAFRDLQDYLEVEGEAHQACLLACTVLGYKSGGFGPLSPVNPNFDPRATIPDTDRIEAIQQTAAMLLRKPAAVRRRLWLYQSALTVRVRKILNDETLMGLALKS